MEKNFKIGHYTDKENITGCTVILCPSNTVASCYIPGAAPGSRETALLAPERKVNIINGLLLTGGSAFGLNAAAGVMKYLEEKGEGYETPYGVVPIVPAAVIYDLNIGNPGVRPTAENAYIACQNATDNFTDQGNIGAGTGATVGKWSGLSGAMKGGLGIAQITLKDIVVRAVSVANSVGDIVDEKGKIVAGAVDKNKKIIGDGNLIHRWNHSHIGFAENTVLIAVLTNAKITKLEAYVLSKRAQSGIARAVVPATTSYDGDIIFTLANGQETCDIDLLCEIATEAVRQSLIMAVRNAENLGNFPAVKDLDG